MTLPFHLILAHFAADFILQSDWMALNKSKDNAALTAHAGTYAAYMFGWLLMTYGVHTAAYFAGITYAAHWATDYITSRVTSKLFFFRPTPSGDFWLPIPKNRHWFFCMIGFDQLLHYAQLAITYRLLIGG